MNVAEHAGKILAAWNVADPVRFERELESALHSCRRAVPAGRFEFEQQEVLESIVEGFRSTGVPGGNQLREVHAGFALLAHLSQRAAAAL